MSREKESKREDWGWIFLKKMKRWKTLWIPLCSLLLICSFTLDTSLNFSWPQFFQPEPKGLACSVVKETHNGQFRWNNSFFSVLAPHGSIFTTLLSSSPLNVRSIFVHEMYATKTKKKKIAPPPHFQMALVRRLEV